jgi:hypothetical protein
MRRFAIAIGVLATLVGTSVHAADIPVKVPQPLPQAAWNWSGFYIGVGGSLNWADFNQSLQGVSGVTNVMLGQTLVAQGQAGGPSRLQPAQIWRRAGYPTRLHRPCWRWCLAGRD